MHTDKVRMIERSSSAFLGLLVVTGNVKNISLTKTLTLCHFLNEMDIILINQSGNIIVKSRPFCYPKFLVSSFSKVYSKITE